MSGLSEAQINRAADAIFDLRMNYAGEDGLPSDRSMAIAALEAAQGAAPAVSGSTSDGHHTFDELYEYRMLYNAHAAHGWLAAGIPVVKSWRHSDGEECFGGGWFIVTATLPSGQVSNHYKAEHWELFTVPEVDLPPEYDGHTPQVAAERLRAAQGAAWLREGVAPQEPKCEHGIALIDLCQFADQVANDESDPQELQADRDSLEARNTQLENWPCLTIRAIEERKHND